MKKLFNTNANNYKQILNGLYYNLHYNNKIFFNQSKNFCNINNNNDDIELNKAKSSIKKTLRLININLNNKHIYKSDTPDLDDENEHITEEEKILSMKDFLTSDYETNIKNQIEKIKDEKKNNIQESNLKEYTESEKQLLKYAERLKSINKDKIKVNPSTTNQNKQIPNSFENKQGSNSSALAYKASLKEIKSKDIIPDVLSNLDKKELKYNSHNFEKIEVMQKTDPPQLTLDLDVVVQNPGIYTIDDIRKLTSEINPNYSTNLLENLPTPDMIEFENFEKYKNPYEDEVLINLMKKKGAKIASSTSGISSTLSHFFYKLTNFKSPHFYGLSENYTNESLKFMSYQRKPSSIVVNRHKGNFYSISKAKVFEDKNEFILLKMGKYMEKIFTCDEYEFKEKYMNKGKFIDTSEPEYFNYVGYDKVLLRSQIDCGMKKKMPDGTNKDIVFEIKTRAICPIRYDVRNYQDYLDYEINQLTGISHSFEREFYDLIRGAFLKYIFQLKIGSMDGAFISYHNTQKIFGFEYITLKDMERRVFGNSNFSDLVFKASLKLLQDSFLEILKFYPNDDKLYFGVYANEPQNVMNIFVERAEGNIYDNVDINDYASIPDFYHKNKYIPNVDKYTIFVDPTMNNVNNSNAPILYEKNDSFNVSYKVVYSGKADVNDYIKFINEAYYSQEVNYRNEYLGLWRLRFENNRVWN